MKTAGAERVSRGISPEPTLEDASTRDRVARSILEHGPSTAGELAERLNLTPAAVRRHLAVLTDVGHLTSRERRVYGARGRGRPAKVFCLTDAGRGEFYQAYDALAVRALEFLREADLQNHLENANKPKDTKTPAQPQAKPQSAPKNEEEPAEPPSRELASKSDYQLSQALNLLKGLQIMQNKPPIDQSASHETPGRDTP